MTKPHLQRCTPHLLDRLENRQGPAGLECLMEFNGIKENVSKVFFPPTKCINKLIVVELPETKVYKSAQKGVRKTP